MDDRKTSGVFLIITGALISFFAPRLAVNVGSPAIAAVAYGAAALAVVPIILGIYRLVTNGPSGKK